MPQHTPTPTPWHESTDMPGHVFAGDRLVAGCRGHDDSRDRFACQRENEANAALIVRAVNTHAAAMEVLQTLADLTWTRSNTTADDCLAKFKDIAQTAIDKLAAATPTPPNIGARENEH